MSTDRTLVIRSGALGDLLLTLPLLARLRSAGRRTALLTRRSYFPLLEGSGLAAALHDVDAVGLEQLGPELGGAEVLSFWSDRDGRLAETAKQAGARSFRVLDSRPRSPPHASLRWLRDAGFVAAAADLDVSHLERPGDGEGALWLHPGSGSPAKNAPLEDFTALARSWRGRVVVSAGEAELEDLERLRAAFAGRAEFCVHLPLAELRTRLAREAALFVGNDTGPTHLAAALGIPTAAVFTTTDPAVWRPVGARVQVAPDLASLALDRVAPR